MVLGAIHVQALLQVGVNSPFLLFRGFLSFWQKSRCYGHF